jgi:uncharacterized protein involved in response to NO
MESLFAMLCAMEDELQKSNRATREDFGKEPFRIFFPAGVIAGVVGVALWPLHFSGAVAFYPGQAHVRLMAYGFFGAFIFGFLGTALPRMLSARPFGFRNVVILLGIYSAMLVAYTAGKIVWGDALLLGLLVVFASIVIPRALHRKDTPPPGFVLVMLAWVCVITGAVLAILQSRMELDLFWVNLQRLLSSQGFVLLPILGIGPFLLPRFFGLESTHDFPEMTRPSGAWIRKAILAMVTGLVVIGSFVLEARGEFRWGHGVRFAACLVYLGLEFPFAKAPRLSSALGASLWVAFSILLAGFLTVAVFPEYRVGLLHLTLVGGFAVITFVVATRVVFGHSGNIQRLKTGNRWLLVAVGMMLFGMATRISGDFWPKIMASHYNYGAVLWAAGVALWAWKVLPKVRMVEKE